MSIVGKLLGWTGLPQWAVEMIALAIAALIVWGWWVHHNHVLVAQGVSQQQSADNAAKAKLDIETAAKTAALAARVAAAEAQGEKAKYDLDQYRASHPLTADRLCGRTAHDSGGGLPGAAGIHGSGSPAAAPAGGDQPMPAADSPGPADRLRLLDALGALSDGLASQVSGLQARLGIDKR